MKHRGRSLETGSWVYGSLIEYRDGKKVIFDPLYEEYHEVAPETVGQWTTLVDKNKKEIYEDDIITAQAYPFYSEGLLNYVGHVGIDVDGCYYNMVVVSDRVRGSAVGGDLSEIHEACEVIGNATDNPELLVIDKKPIE